MGDAEHGADSGVQRRESWFKGGGEETGPGFWGESCGGQEQEWRIDGIRPAAFGDEILGLAG